MPPTATATGWAATVTNPAVAGASPANCGVFSETAAAPNAAVTNEGSPGCW